MVIAEVVQEVVEAMVAVMAAVVREVDLEVGGMAVEAKVEVARGAVARVAERAAEERVGGETVAVVLEGGMAVEMAAQMAGAQEEVVE